MSHFFAKIQTFLKAYRKQKSLIMALGLLSFSVATFANTQDVLYLKNGSIIKGQITEMNPNGNIKIQTADGSLFVYQMSDVLKTEKQEMQGGVSNSAVSSNQTVGTRTDVPVIEINKKKSTITAVIGNDTICPRKNKEYEQLYRSVLDQDLYIEYQNSKGFKTGTIICSIGAGLLIGASFGGTGEGVKRPVLLGLGITSAIGGIVLGFICQNKESNIFREHARRYPDKVIYTHHNTQRESIELNVQPAVFLSDIQPNTLSYGATLSLAF